MGELDLTTNLLIDLDSKIPNLALMQLSAYLKRRGESVVLRTPFDHPDRVWISCVFTWNASRARGVGRMWESTGAEVHLGGTGIDFVQDEAMRLRLVSSSALPDGAIDLPPDYSLYSNDDRAVGFVARGCNRRCEFCVVPLKEGRIGRMWPIREWHQERDKILLLDNDLPLGPYHNAVLQECQDNDFKLSITQGYDIRCVARGDVDDEGLKLLVEVRPWDIDFRTHRLYIAWDYLGIESYVRQGLERLFRYGLRSRDVMCYILCGFNTTHEQDYHRFKVLWNEYHVMPYVMPYNRRRDDKWLNAFARWVNRGYSRLVKFEDYRDGILARELRTKVPLAGIPVTEAYDGSRS